MTGKDSQQAGALRFDESARQIAANARFIAGGVNSNFRLGMQPGPLVFERVGAYAGRSPLQLGKPVEDGRPSAQPEILGKPMDDDKPKQQASLAKPLNDLLFGAGGPAAEKYKNSPLADQTK